MAPSTDQLLELLAQRHPWLRLELEQTATATYAHQWRLPLPLEEAWQVLSDTSRLNRALHIPTAAFDEVDGRRTGQSTYFGQVFKWSEPPWEWCAPHVFVCRKLFVGGPIERMFSVASLEGEGDHTLVTLWYGWVPRGWLGGFAARRINGYLARNFDSVMPQLIDSFASQAPSPLVRPAGSRVPGAEQRVVAATAALTAAVGEAAAQRMIRHVMDGDPMELDRLRPFALADRWGLDREDVLAAHLAATRCGLALARWDVVCPHCRGPRATLELLDDLQATAQCDACNVLFETGGSSLDLTFRVHPAIRHIERRIYCAAEPATKPHIAMQLCNDVPRAVRVPFEPGNYLVRSEAKSLRFTIEESAPSTATLEQGMVAPGGRLTFPPTPSRWVMERIEAVVDAVRPQHVLSMEAYRAVMGTEALAADLALEIGVQTLLFTDIVGSTGLYEELGDRAAFEAVRRHFEVIAGLTKAEGGTVIKTIGDSVMAAFTTPEAAGRAARHITSSDLGTIRLRLSLHSGPCIAVNLDTGVDYFGAVVNEAAKLQAAAGAGEVAMTPALAAQLGVEGRAETYRYGPETHDAVVWCPAPTSTPAGAERQVATARPV